MAAVPWPDHAPQHESVHQRRVAGKRDVPAAGGIGRCNQLSEEGGGGFAGILRPHAQGSGLTVGRRQGLGHLGMGARDDRQVVAAVPAGG